MKAKQQHNWAQFFGIFTEQNVGRKTRIAVYQGAPDSLTDYWLEDGLPLVGVDIDPDGERGPAIQIMLQKPGQVAHMTHTVTGATSVKFTLSASGNADGLEIDNSDGETTVLQFED